MTVWLNADQVAERLGVARRTALSLMEQMQYVVISGTAKRRIRVSEAELEAWMMKRSIGRANAEVKCIGTKAKLKRR